MDVRSVRLVALLGLVLVLAGCLSGGGGPGTATPTVGTQTTAVPDTRTPSTEPATAVPTAARCRAPETGTPTRTSGQTPGTGASGTPTATERGFEFSPDRETPVVLWNRWDRSVNVRVRVVCVSTNETVHDETVEVFPDGSLSVYDLAEANPERGVPLRVVVTARNTTESVTVRTTECADVTAEVSADGELRVRATC